MEAYLGTNIWVYLVQTVIITGGASAMMGRAIAITWRPAWQVVLYGVLLGFADRFLVFALWEGELLHLQGFLICTVTILMIALVTFRAARARAMVHQYPWLYKPAGLFGWEPIGEQD